MPAGNPDEALRCFQQAATLKPDFAPLQTSLGLLLQRRSDPGWCCEGFFPKLVQLTPSDPEAHNNLALAMLQRGEADAAIKEFREAILLRPDDAGFSRQPGNGIFAEDGFRCGRGTVPLGPQA